MNRDGYMSQQLLTNILTNNLLITRVTAAWWDDTILVRVAIDRIYLYSRCGWTSLDAGGCVTKVEDAPWNDGNL